MACFIAVEPASARAWSCDDVMITSCINGCYDSREYIEWFQTGSPDSLEERLSRDADFRQFIL